MKWNWMQKGLAYALAFSVALAPTMSVKASSMDDGASQSAAVSEIVSVQPSAELGGSVTVGGKEVKSTVSGFFHAGNVKGVAVVTPKQEISAAIGLQKGETARVSVGKSFCGPQAQACLKTAADAMQVSMGPVLDISMGKVTAAGKYVQVDETVEPISFTVGIPDSFRGAGQYYVINVQPGGKVVLLMDTDEDPNTFTFETTGFGVFALAK